MRLSPKQAIARRVKIAYFKWEFLRRNPDYKREYGETMACGRGAALRKVGYPGPGYARRVGPELGRIVGAQHWFWNVAFMQAPRVSVSLKEMLKSAASRERNPFWRAHENTVIDAFEVIATDTARFKNPALSLWASKHSSWHVLAVNINANADGLVRDVERRLREVIASKKQDARQLLRRFREDDLPNYLTAWDLHEKGRTNVQIAKALFPSVAKEIGLAARNATYRHRTEGSKPLRDDSAKGVRDIDLEPWTKRVSRYIAIARDLIQGDYRLLSP